VAGKETRMNIRFFFGVLTLSILAACAANTDETADPSPGADTAVAADEAVEGEDAVDQAADALKPVTYKQTGKVITKTCGGCHAQFTTLAGIKAQKTEMAAMISAGRMPKGKPTWKNSASGKKVLLWLQTGTDL
jgi:cytochrome c5